MVAFLEIINHLLSLIITLVLVAGIWIYRVGLPYLHFIALVVNADDEEGINKFAHYLAKHTGGRGINVDAEWEAFVPAARTIHLAYHNKIRDTISA